MTIRTDSGEPITAWVSNPNNWDDTYRDITLYDPFTGNTITARIFAETPIYNGAATLWAVYVIDLGDVVPMIDYGTSSISYEQGQWIDTPHDWQTINWDEQDFDQPMLVTSLSDLS